MISDAIVIDCGSGLVRAGFTGDAEPCVKIPAVYQGKRPVVRGIVQDWGAWTGLLSQTFTALGVNPAGKLVLLTESLLNPNTNREQATRILFDTFGVGGMYLAKAETLVINAMGLTTGFVVMAGYGVTYTVAVRDSYAMPESILRMDFAGSDLDTRMKNLLAAEGTAVDLDTAQAMKENLGYVALDYDATMQSGGQGPGTYQGRTANKARFQTPEALFQPTLAGVQFGSIHEAAYNSIMRCDFDVRGAMFANTIAAGGSTCFPGMVERLTKEMKALAPPSAKVVVTPAPSEAAWKGGAKLGRDDGFLSSWVTRQDYTTSGPSIVQTKCF